MHTQIEPVILQQLLQAIALTENGIAILDAENRVRFCNPAIAKLFGLDESSVLGHTADEILATMHASGRGLKMVGQSLADRQEAFRSQIRSGPFRVFELELTDGRCLLMTEQLNPDDSVILLCSDITQQKQTEYSLRESQLELARQALVDELTGLPNRRHFLQRLEEELNRSMRHAHPLTVAMIDLDHFKRVNDRYGHAAGDDVLRHFADFLSKLLRKSDVAGRLGGEEFALFLPETPLDDAVGVLQRTLEQLAGERLTTIHPEFSYAFSAGVVLLTDVPNADVTSLLACADQALYQAKAAGRNRVAAYSCQ